jgi:hypothetical protein
MKIGPVFLRYDYGKKSRGESLEAVGFYPALNQISDEVYPFWFDEYLDKKDEFQRKLIEFLDAVSPDVVFFIIRPYNWNITSHQYFNKIITWNDDFIDNIKYSKMNFPNKVPTDLNFELTKKNKFCTMIAGHKFNSHPLELYAERVKAIRWFEQNHPKDFDFYGMCWDKYCFKNQFSSLNYIKVLTKLLKPKYPSYKRTIKSKREVLQKYKFAICYENVRDILGYILKRYLTAFLRIVCLLGYIKYSRIGSSRYVMDGK